jgi:hypothetical protein
VNHLRAIRSCLTLVWIAAAAVAQEAPKPAPELQKLAPLIGNWQGSGTASMGPGEPSKWQAHSTYAWALGNHFVQEDTVVTFADMDKPIVIRSYLGWDRENQRYAVVSASNEGEAGVHRLELEADGTMVQMISKFRDGKSFIERWSSRIDGDSMQLAADVLMAQDASKQVVTGTMQRVVKPAPLAMNASAFMATPVTAMQRLAKTAGTYDVKATMTMMPGTPEMKITGTDVVTLLFDGTIVHVRSTGTAEGMPDQYDAQLFYGWNARDKCITAAMVSNMGEVGEMTGRFTEDGRQFVLTAAATFMGQPCVQRMVLNVDSTGAAATASGHCLLGTAAPFESWKSTYTKQK